MESLGVNFANDLDNFHSSEKWPKFIAIDDVNLRAAAEFASELLKCRLEIIFAKENAGQAYGIQLSTKHGSIDEWCTKDFERSRSAASF